MHERTLPAVFQKLEKLRPFYDWTYTIVMFICKLLLIADIAFTCVAVIARYIAQWTGIIIDSSWCEQLVLTCMIYMAVLSAALAIRKGSHIRMTAMDSSLPVTAIRVLDLAADAAVAILAVIMIRYGLQGSLRQLRSVYESIPGLSRFWMFFPIPLAGFSMIVFELECIYQHIKAFFLPAEQEQRSTAKKKSPITLVCILLYTAAVVIAAIVIPDVRTKAIIVLLGGFLAMILLRFPIAYAVALASILCLAVQGRSLIAVVSQMVKGVWSFSMMAVPFFITMGVLMGSGGISTKLIALANSCVGWMRGGMSMVNILASYFFGGISGSASADTASLGSILIPMMVDQGYDDDFSTAVTITSSCEGLLVPPSHNMVIYATTAGGISVGSLFMAGYLPGALLALSLMVGSYIISVRRHYPKGEPFSITELGKQLVSSIWALLAIIIVVAGVVGGMFTATESAAIAVIYSLVVSVFVYKGLDWKGVWRELSSCIDTLAIVLILIATSSLFGYCLTLLHVPEMAAQWIVSVSGNPIVIALLLNVILLVLGCIMDMAPIILIATPILLPLAKSIGIDPIQFGIMIVLNCGIGLLTPPVGSVLFIGSAVGKVPMERVVKATLPFYACMLVALLLVTFVPQISLLLPQLSGYVSQYTGVIAHMWVG